MTDLFASQLEVQQKMWGYVKQNPLQVILLKAIKFLPGASQSNGDFPSIKQLLETTLSF